MLNCILGSLCCQWSFNIHQKSFENGTCTVIGTICRRKTVDVKIDLHANGDEYNVDDGPIGGVTTLEIKKLTQRSTPT